MREEPTLVERLIDEKMRVNKRLSELESFRRNIRLGDTFEIEQPVPSRLRRMFFLGRGRAGDGERKQISPEIVRQFYRFTSNESDKLGTRINEINAELESRSKTDMKEN